MAEVNAKSVAEEWLSAFASSLSPGSSGGIPSLFTSGGYLRDSLVFTWDCRTIHGGNSIQDFLSTNLPDHALHNFQLDTSSPHLSPVLDKSDPSCETIKAFFVFETERALCRGAVSLIQAQGSGESSSWKALSVFTAVADWKAYEEAPYLDVQNQNDAEGNWYEHKLQGRVVAESDPTVLIVGAGQSGLQLAARLRQSGISCLLLEKEARVGDNWRKRYPSLKLHVPRTYCQLLYQPYPSNYPEYIPKDVVANWLEAYALAQNLHVWTSSTLESAPSYDPTARTWTVGVIKDGQRIILHPRHLVMALGPFGEGTTPEVKGRDIFEGSQTHSEHFPGGREYASKRVLVFGAGNSASDICVDLVQNGAKSVTLFQRSPTCVHSRKYIRSLVNAFFPDNVPIDVTDFKMDTMPVKLMIEFFRAQQKAAREYDKEMLNGLEAAGLKLWDGPSGAGYIELGLTRGGVFDSGFASLVSDSMIKLKTDVDITRFTEKSVVFSDGSELEVDAIVYATGYRPVRDTYKRILGEKFVDETPEIWDLDEEGEVRGVYRPAGHPGFWYAAGDFSFSRRSSKRLALLIRAFELGYYVP
ncbi:hypothetical protein ACEPAI_8119 [Sanghuangporus weigelae]